MKKCSSYHITAKKYYIYNAMTGASIAHERKVGECWGTRECDECYCGGDRRKCDFYEDVRKEALKPKFGEWISVDDMLPEIETANIKCYNSHYSKSIRVLCACKQRSGKVLVKEGYCELYEDGRVYWKIPGNIDSVTHWMPLPKSPEEDDTK